MWDETLAYWWFSTVGFSRKTTNVTTIFATKIGNFYQKCCYRCCFVTLFLKQRCLFNVIIQNRSSPLDIIYFY